MVTKQSKFSTTRPYQFGDASKAFTLRNPEPISLAKGSNVPWFTPAQDLGELPSQADLTATRA